MLGYENLLPKDHVTICFHLKIDAPDPESMNERIIFALARMQYTLGAMKEFFTRRDVKVRIQNIEQIYERVAGQQRPTGFAPSFPDTAFFQMMRLLRSMLQNPSGRMDAMLYLKQWLRIRNNSMMVSVRSILQFVATEAARQMSRLPTHTEVTADLKRFALEPWVLGLKISDTKGTRVWLDADWVLRHRFVEKRFLKICKSTNENHIKRKKTRKIYFS
jgi:hypothetical protein